MKWRLVFALVCALFAGRCLAFDTVIAPNTRITKNLFFLLDVSGSMYTSKLNKAIDAVLAIASQETDDLNIAVLTFQTNTVRWPGRPHTEQDGSPPEGWATMPSEENRKALAEWLGMIKSNGGTAIAPALRQALREKAPKDRPLTVILVSDGGFEESNDTIAAIIAEAQEARARDGNKAVLVLYGIDSREDIENDRMFKVAKIAEKDKTLGGYFVDSSAVTGPH